MAATTDGTAALVEDACDDDPKEVEMEPAGSTRRSNSRAVPTTDTPPPTAIVGIGASAGGLEALEKFFDHAPAESGLAYVVVQHLPSHFKSQMDELLSHHTSIPVHRATDGMRVQPDAIYLLPPKKEMTLFHGRLRLRDPDPAQSHGQPIDTFFRSLAHDAGPRAIALVLSGTGSDGSGGIRSIHDLDGLVIVQDPDTAKYDGMPRSALDTGMVDRTLPPEAMPAAILASVVLPGQRSVGTGAMAASPQSTSPREEPAPGGPSQSVAHEEPAASPEQRSSPPEDWHSSHQELPTESTAQQPQATELARAVHDLEAVLQSTNVGAIFLDRDLRIRKVTSRAANAFHIQPQDIGQRIDHLAANLHGDQLIQDIERARDSEVPADRQVCDQHGHWYALRILPERCGAVTTGIVITLVGVNTAKATQRELNLMSKVFMDGTDPIIIEDLDGYVRYVNDEAVRVYGWTREELVGNRVEMLLSDSERHRSEELRRWCRNHHPVRNVETVRRTKSGTLQPVLLTLSLLTDEADQPLAIASIAKDITDRKQAEQQCRDAVQRRDQFLAMLSHELRNPLGAIINATYLLEQNCRVPTSCCQPCAVIDRQAHLMARLLDDLLDVSRVMQGKIDVRLEPCDLRRAAEAALEVVRPQIAGRDQELLVDIEPTPLIVNGDAVRLQQIHVNLLHNAMKYTPAGGTIWLTMRREDGEAVLRVRDTGAGIPVELLQSVFDLFMQAGGTLDRSEGGMGVGLTLVQLLVGLHGGNVAAYSDGSGMGSEFVVRLPLFAAKISSDPIKFQPPKPAEFRRILIVEDNADSREMLRTLLELHGYSVEAAEDGRVGLSLLEKQQFDMALIDIGLPGIDGYEVARRIRRDPRHRTIRLVALTGYGRTADHEAVQAAGFDEHFVKPLDPQKLTRLLARSEQDSSTRG